MHSAIAIEDEHVDLAATAARVAARYAPVARTRENLPGLADGSVADPWRQLVDGGLHSLHLPESLGGAGAGLVELAVVARELGAALVPGPWLPTALAGGVLALAGAPQFGDTAALRAVDGALAAFADGARGCLVRGGSLRCRSTGDNWTLDGTSDPAVGLPGAQRVVVRATSAETDEPRWFVLDLSNAPADVVVVEPATDLTRPVGRLTLTGYQVPVGALADVDPDRADLVAVTILGAEAVGAMAWALDTTIGHVSSREQFGKPIGSFQAVQHRVALMLVQAEAAAALVWDAARALHQAPDQQRLAAAAVGTQVPSAAIDVVLDCISLLGAIGFTWEHDAHLHLRRALALASSAGESDGWARRLGAAAMVSTRDFSLVSGSQLPELRREVGALLDQVAQLPADTTHDRGWHLARGGPRQQLLADAGLVAPHYPSPWGRAAGVLEQAVIADEFSRRGLTPPTTVVGEWLMPALIQYGTPEQQERFMRPTLRGEVVWCQLFSEPSSGSDLASLRTRAQRVPGGWRLTGQKVWTSYAHLADWGICLARSNPDVPRHSGISCFLVDLRSPGVQVRPLRQSTGDAEFNEVFLDDVFVPDDLVVGDVDDGWRVAAAALANERLSMGARLGHGSSRLATDESSGADLADRLRVGGRSAAREQALAAMRMRSALVRASSGSGAAHESVIKVYNALVQQRGSRDAIGLLGADGVLAANPVVADHLGLPAVLFGGGTIEIQLNVIARRVLRLPG